MTAEGAGPRKPRAVVFDLDGTLVHTTVDFRRMKVIVIEELWLEGVPSGLLDPRVTIVENMSRAGDHLTATGRGGDIDGLHRRIGDLMNHIEMEKVGSTRAIEGASGCLSTLRKEGLRIGLLTRGSRAYVLAALQSSGLGNGFDAMVCRDDHPEEEAKPNGMAMNRVADLLRVRPQECILVGDHLMDLSCARSASAGFVGVLTGTFSEDDWERNGRPLVIGSVAELPELLLSGKGI